MIRAGNRFSDDLSSQIKYFLTDNMDSCSILLDETFSNINREEITLFGGGLARKGYRFTGNQKDEETGLYYHGAISAMVETNSTVVR